MKWLLPGRAYYLCCCCHTHFNDLFTVLFVDLTYTCGICSKDVLLYNQPSHIQLNSHFVCVHCKSLFRLYLMVIIQCTHVEFKLSKTSVILVLCGIVTVMYILVLLLIVIVSIFTRLQSYVNRRRGNSLAHIVPCKEIVHNDYLKKFLLRSLTNHLETNSCHSITINV